MTDDTLDVPEAALSLGMTRSAVQKAIHRGKLAATRVPTVTGYKYLTTVGEVERYRDRHRTTRLADR
jgi:hypothetical protein